CTVLPSILVITSPSLRPAFAAGLPACTELTRAPAPPSVADSTDTPMNAPLCDGTVCGPLPELPLPELPLPEPLLPLPLPGSVGNCGRFGAVAAALVGDESSPGAATHPMRKPSPATRSTPATTATHAGTKTPRPRSRAAATGAGTGGAAAGVTGVAA